MSFSIKIAKSIYESTLSFWLEKSLIEIRVSYQDQNSSFLAKIEFFVKVEIKFFRQNRKKLGVFAKTHKIIFSRKPANFFSAKTHKLSFFRQNCKIRFFHKNCKIGRTAKLDFPTKTIKSRFFTKIIKSVFLS